MIYNRTDGSLGKRLDGFTLKVLDDRAQRRLRASEPDGPPTKRRLPGRRRGAENPQGPPRAAMIALTSVRGQEAETFQALAQFVRR